MTSEARHVSLGYLRTTLTLLVVAHHAVLAYHPFAPPLPHTLGESQIWGAFPVVDSARWPGIELFVGFNDTFFMALMFLISGLFAWGSLERKGRWRFVRERASKLGTGFVASVLVLAPLAYYPTFLSLGPQTTSFARQWLGLSSWPAGPAWFLWVLLAFAGLAALVHPAARRFYPSLGVLGERPARFLALFVALSALAYIPMASAFSVFHWAALGPFYVQTSRVFLYALYFFAGLALGAHGLERGLLAGDGKLARRWPLWATGALLAFGLSLVAFVLVVSSLPKGGPGPLLGAASHFAFVLSCATISLAFVALFVRFVRRPNRLMDSLDANAFGIYLGHYACVSWLQWLLLGAALPGAAKGTLVFLGAVLLSWALSAGLRRLGSPRPPALPAPYPPPAAAA